MRLIETITKDLEHAMKEKERWISKVSQLAQERAEAMQKLAEG